MKGDAAADQQHEEVEKVCPGGQSALRNTPSVDRRRSIEKLQGMLKRVSQSPFHNQYRTLPSTSDSSHSGSSMNESQNKQDGELLGDLSAAEAPDKHQLHPGQNGGLDQQAWNPFYSSPQNGVKFGGLARVSPYYAHFTESSSETPKMDGLKRGTSEDPSFSTIFAPPPEFQSSPADFTPEVQTFENSHTAPPDPQKDVFQSLTHSNTQDLFQTSTFPQNTPANGSDNFPDAFKAPEPRDPFQTSQSSDTDRAKGEELLAASLFDTSQNNVFDPFHLSSNNHGDLIQPPPSNDMDPFQSFSPKEVDLFQDPFAKENERFNTKAKVDIFSPLFPKTDDPFQSINLKDSFQNSPSMSDPFATPSKPYDPFQDLSNGTPDLFRPLPSKTQDGYEPFHGANSSYLFDTTPSSAASKVPAASLSSPTEKTSDVLSPSSAQTPSNSHPAADPTSSDIPHEIILVTPQGTKHDILQPTPFSQARTVASPSETSPQLTHVQPFKRPPKPLPRTRPPRPVKSPRPANSPRPAVPPRPVNSPRPENPTEPELTSPKPPPKPAPKPPPKPVSHIRQTVQDSKPEEGEDVFEDILLIGQERCVEDWPEDSPELDPDFKPSGRFRLRRESMKVKEDLDGGSGEDQDGAGSHGKKKERKFKVHLLSRRSSKDKFSDELKDGKSGALHRGSKDGFPDTHFLSAGENEDDEQNAMDYKPQKKHLKTRVSKLLRRGSAASIQDAHETKPVNGHLPQGFKDDDIHKNKAHKKSSIIRRWSEGTMLEGTSEEEGDEARHEHADSHKRKKMLKIKFVPQRGFAISLEKTGEDLKGAHGYTPRRGSKEKPQDGVHGAYGYTPRKKPEDDTFEDVEGATGYTQSTGKAAFTDGECPHKGVDQMCSEDELEDCRPKKPAKLKLPHVGRRSSKDEMFDDTSPRKSSISAGEMEDEEQNGMEDCKPKNYKHKGPLPTRRKFKTSQDAMLHERSRSHHAPQQGVFVDDDIPQKGADLFSPGEMYKDEQDDIDDFKPKKPSKLKGLRKHKAKSKAMTLEYENPPGATSSDYYLSEAAEAEWLAAQMDERLAAGLEEGEEEGDTDSLMEWWNTVEQWDEVPSDDEDKVIKDDESKSFTILAEKVHRGLQVFNKVFTERAEVLWQYIIRLHAIADDISNFHKKAKIANITGGTTTAVGGVAAIAGLALAPITFGASLIVTAVGVGVATAGGIASASATISDNVNNMHDRKKVETVLQDYEAHLLDIRKILHFVSQGLYRLRGHPFLRAGNQHYSEDWEIRRTVQMISLADFPAARASDITDETVASVQALFTGMDKYFIKDSRELKKGCKKEVVGQIRGVAKLLNDGLVELNAIREALQEANGTI